ncbi:hypothetical protein PT286_02315 [Neisseriaceae bacterium ESL0693]|nr:hypothetical protein [Neisseriaceae bacterium ESL0693]
MQKLIKKLEKTVLAILCSATLYWVMDNSQNPYITLPTYEKSVTLESPEHHLGKNHLFLTDQHGMDPTKKFKVNCYHFRNRNPKSFCDLYQYHMSLVKIFNVKATHLYNHSSYNTNDLIITSMTFRDPYDGKTKVFQPSAQDITDWKNFFINRRSFHHKLLSITLPCWVIYFLYLFLKRRHQKRKQLMPKS